MKKMSIALVALVCTAFAVPAMAQKDKDNPGQGRGNSDKGGPKNAGGDGPGQGRGQGQGQNQGQGPGFAPGNPQAAAPSQVNIVVTERDRSALYGYYRPMYAAGNCPPGLAKKNNGCLPPGQAKKMWVIGQPLPAAIVDYPLPGPLLVQLTPAPAGYQYVRVANDILTLAIGTRLIAGAIADLGSMR